MLKTICLVSPGHLGSNPRLVKEADVLAEAGYVTHVVFGDSHPPVRERDADLQARADWTIERVSCLGKAPDVTMARLESKLARLLWKSGFRGVTLAKKAHHPMTALLEATVLKRQVDYYIGHCLAALPAVVRAAAHFGAKVGFDAEDFHSGEALDTRDGRIRNGIAEAIERHYLPQLDFATAASPLIAAEYERRYGVKMTPILNVFPLSEAVEPVAANPVIPSFYWFSQTIGPGRGLEEFLAIATATKRRMRIDFRGEVRAEYGRELNSMVDGSDVELRLLPPEVPSQMVACAAGYTAGLALERKTPLNRDLCLTNKAFTYLLAGVPVILSCTQAQERLAMELDEAALLIDLDNVGDAVNRLTAWLRDDNRLKRSQYAAFSAGRNRFHWEKESRKLPLMQGIQESEI